MSHVLEGHVLARSDELLFQDALRQAVFGLEQAGLAYALMGGLGSSLYGRPRFTDDIDFFVRPQDALPVLEVLGRVGFITEETDPYWLYKAFWGAAGRDVMVDIIFRSAGDIYLDDEMLCRALAVPIGGVTAKVLAAEDLICIKAVTMGEAVPHHWFDALGLIAAKELDWEYLLRRASHVGLRRVLSLLLYAQSNDLGVPNSVIRRLSEEVVA